MSSKANGRKIPPWDFFCNTMGFCGSPCGKRHNHQGEHRCGICGLLWKSRKLKRRSSARARRELS